MRISGRLRPIPNSQLRLGAINVVSVTWNTSAGSLGSSLSGSSFTRTLSATSSTGASVGYSIVAGALPTGLTLNPATGVITGVIAGAGLAAFTVRATAGGRFVDRTFSITTAALTVTWTTPAGELAPISAGAIAATPLVATTNSDSLGVTYSIVSGSLPTGLALTSTGLITGRASNATGTATFTVRARANDVVYADRTFTMRVAPDIITWTTPEGSLGTIMGGAVSDLAVKATSSIYPTMGYVLVYGALPEGLTLDGSNGKIIGTAANLDGTSIFRIRADDGVAFSERQFSITINAHVITWTTSGGTLPDANGGAPYAQTIAATSDENAPVTYSVVGGTFPSGLSLSPGGLISGIPTNIDGVYSFIVRATDGVGFADQSYTITVIADEVVWQTGRKITVNASEPTIRTVQARSRLGAPVTYSMVSGALPTGFGFDANAAQIEGISDTPTTTNVTLRAAVPLTHADQNFEVTVNGVPIWITPAGTLANVSPGQVFSIAVQARDPDGMASYTFANAAAVTESLKIATSGDYGILTGYLTSNNDDTPPTFVTLPNLGTFDEGVSVTSAVHANAASGREIAGYRVINGVLPGGLILDSYTGNISGTTNDAFSSNYSLDPAVGVMPKPTWVTPVNLSAVNEGETYSLTLRATPNKGNAITTYSVVKGLIPWGVTLDTRSGVMSGTVGEVDLDNVFFKQAPKWQTALTSLGTYVEVEGASVANVVVEATSTSNTGIKRYDVVKGVLPWGVTLDAASGKISGTAAFADPSDAHASMAFQAPVWVTDIADLGAFKEGATVDKTLVATPLMGNAMASYSVVNGLLPWGLTLTATTGQISGKLGEIDFADAIAFGPAPEWQTNSVLGTVEEGDTISSALVANSVSNTGIARYDVIDGVLPWGVTLNSWDGGLTGTALFGDPSDPTPTAKANPPMWYTAADLGTFNEGDALATTLQAQSPRVPTTCTFGLVSGKLPLGVTLTSTGSLSGTIGEVDGTDEPVVALPGPTFTTGEGSLGTFSGGAAVSLSLQATTSVGTFKGFEIVRGTLPWGLVLIRETGAITGTVSSVDAAGKTFPFIVRAIGSNGGSEYRSFSISIQ